MCMPPLLTLCFLARCMERDIEVEYFAGQYSQANGLSSECLLRTWFLRVTLFTKPLARQMSHCMYVRQVHPV